MSRRLRRLALDRQGLLKQAPFGRGLGGARRAIEALGYVQIDTISVADRAHDHVLRSRVPGYRPEFLNRLLADGSVFEYWAHAAAYLPLSDYRFARPHMNAMRDGRTRWIRSRDQKLMRRVLDRIRSDGPLQARDFEAPPGRRNAAWWDWKPAKQALEQLFMQGDLMVVRRDGFQKVYELAERVLPSHVDTREPTLAECAAHLVQRHVRAHGFATARACAYGRNRPGLQEAVAGQLAAAHHQGQLTAIDPAHSGTPRDCLYADPAGLQGRAPTAPQRSRLLSPFDNALIQRDRTRALFGFDYQLECYVPEARRRFGYFCLPLLYGDRFVGRADCKAHRSEGRFEVRHLHIEHPDWLPRDRQRAAAVIAAGIAERAAGNGCQVTELGAVQPRDWQAPLVQAVRVDSR